MQVSSAFTRQDFDVHAQGYIHANSHHHDPCCLHRSADIALVAGGNRKRWIIATENMQAGDVIKTSGVIGRMAGVNLSRRDGGDGLVDF